MKIKKWVTGSVMAVQKRGCVRKKREREFLVCQLFFCPKNIMTSKKKAITLCPKSLFLSQKYSDL